MSLISVVGIGPGKMEDMTPRAKKAVEESDVIVGYSTYIDLIRMYYPDKEFISSGMTMEAARCRVVLEKALAGDKVALISSGDSGIYGMAGLMLEVVNRAGAKIPVEIIPGITAASAAAAILGAPIMHDFAVISLSDRLTSPYVIYKRIECAAEGDFVICLYNPKSSGRTEQIEKARDIILRHRDGSTPAGIVRNAGRTDESYAISSLRDMLSCEIDMFSTVIIGNSRTYVENGRIITPRGYKLEGIF